MMIRANTKQERAQFLQAIAAYPPIRAQQQMRLALFGDLPGSGWQFYVTAPEEDAVAIALRGDRATVAGAYDAQELGSFLSFLGTETITTPTEYPPEGYTLTNTLYVYGLQAGQCLTVPPFTGTMAGRESTVCLNREPSVMQVIPLLFSVSQTDAIQAQADIAMQEQYYSDNCTARNYGMAEFWLLYHQDVPVFTLAASAVVGQTAYLSAGETVESYRGQGIGGHYIATMANEYSAKGYEVCFVCEAIRCRFYQRLGFTQTGVLYQYSCNALPGE